MAVEPSSVAGIVANEPLNLFRLAAWSPKCQSVEYSSSRCARGAEDICVTYLASQDGGRAKMPPDLSSSLKRS